MRSKKSIGKQRDNTREFNSQNQFIFTITSFLVTEVLMNVNVTSRSKCSIVYSFINVFLNLEIIV